MPSTFNVQSANAYEQLMGRWSKKLAVPFLEFAGLKEGKAFSTSAAATAASPLRSPRRPASAKLPQSTIRPCSWRRRPGSTPTRGSRSCQADACHLPFADGSFDRALSLLVLHFVPEASKAISEMRRVVRAGGTVAAAVWDHLGGMPAMRMMVDTAAALGESGRHLRERYCFQPMMQPGEMKQTFADQGLSDVTEAQLMIRMTYRDFEDYWRPSRQAKVRSANMSSPSA